MRIAKVMIAMVMVLPYVAVSQEKTPLQFDVITVKPHKEGDTSMWRRWTSSGLEGHNLSLKSLVSVAYDVQPWLVFGLPPWAESTRWDLMAKVTDPEMKPIDKLTGPERLVLIGSILHDRFGLVAHNETKVQPVFVMTAMPDAVKLKQSAPLPPGEPLPKFGRSSFSINNGVAQAKNEKLADLASTLSGMVGRTIIDKTGLTGEYDFEFRWQPESQANGGDNGAADSDRPATIVDALKEQLGLKITADKAPVPTVVVDKILQPEEN
ncbi:TIGR03435 family protein [Terriglobus sp. RCC_193]|uniref:TIGR03435 family protein n=1 Tax=Terriglobus sp. RCC_193 TaxID=3239218 RepID=UPI0035231276